jgi:hypothetical protein
MAISEYTEEFAGKPVLDWNAETGLPDPQNTLPRVSISYDDYENKTSWVDRFAQFLEHPDAAQVSGLVIGAWDFDMGEDSSAIVEAIVTARDRLPRVEAIFLGDITYEECEISWIEQSDITPIFAAYPNLKYFAVRGGNGLELGNLQHENLQALTIQTGGMNAGIVQAVLRAGLPALEHLELWLGTDSYGATVTMQVLQPLFNGDLFPRLRALALRNSDLTDAIAREIINAPILQRIEVLDLSLGILTDEGAAALLDYDKIKHLKKLDVHHHFCSEAMTDQLQELPIERPMNTTAMSIAMFQSANKLKKYFCACFCYHRLPRKPAH